MMKQVNILVVATQPHMPDVRGMALQQTLQDDLHLRLDEVRTAGGEIGDEQNTSTGCTSTVVDLRRPRRCSAYRLAYGQRRRCIGGPNGSGGSRRTSSYLRSVWRRLRR